MSMTLERPKARFAPRRLTHANILVRDLDDPLALHGAVCGATEVLKEPWVKMTILSNGSSHHDMALMQIDDQLRSGRDGDVTTPKGRGTQPGLNDPGWEMGNGKVPVVVTDGPGKNGVVLSGPDGLLEFYLPAPGRAWSAADARPPRDLHLV